MELYVAPVLGPEYDPRSGAKKLSPHCGGTTFWPQIWGRKTTPKMEPRRQPIFELLTGHANDHKRKGNVTSNGLTKVYMTYTRGPRLQLLPNQIVHVSTKWGCSLKVLCDGQGKSKKDAREPLVVQLPITKTQKARGQPARPPSLGHPNCFRSLALNGCPMRIVQEASKRPVCTTALPWHATKNTSNQKNIAETLRVHVCELI